MTKCNLAEYTGYFIRALLTVGGIAGWVMNIIKLFGTDDTLEAFLRIVSIFVFPVGAIYGWF